MSSSRSNHLKNVFYSLLQPGTVIGFIPYFVFSYFPEQISLPNFLEWFSILFFLLGLSLLIWSISIFSIYSEGTISPIDPSNKLVLQGPYKYSRNPMYLGVLMCLISEAIYFSSTALFLYTLSMFLLFHTFIIFHEEPRQKKIFGKPFEKYLDSVNRWI